MDDGGAGGKDTGLEITFDPVPPVGPPDNLSSDGNGMYIDKDGVQAFANGHIILGLGKGNHDRQVQLSFSCAGIDLDDDNVDDIDGCNQLQLLSEEPPDVFGINGIFPEDGGNVQVRVNPYKMNCPTDVATPDDDECPNVFTMGITTEDDDLSELMSLQVGFGEGLRINVDDAIGGATAFDAGHCLALLTVDERTAYLNAECMEEVDDELVPNPSNCNVTVTATGTDADGKNNAWRIDTDPNVDGTVTGLICQFGVAADPFVIGKTTLTFGVNAVEKP